MSTTTLLPIRSAYFSRDRHLKKHDHIHNLPGFSPSLSFEFSKPYVLLRDDGSKLLHRNRVLARAEDKARASSSSSSEQQQPQPNSDNKQFQVQPLTPSVLMILMAFA